MSAAPNQGTVIFCAPIVGSTTEDRAIVEHDEGNWTVGRVQRADRTKFEREFSFSMGDLIQAATWGFEGNPHISTSLGSQPGKGLSAGIVLLLMAIGIIKTEPKT